MIDREQLALLINKELALKKIERGETKKGEFFFLELNNKLEFVGLGKYKFKSYRSFINHISNIKKEGVGMNIYVAILLGNYLKINIVNKLVEIAREEIKNEY